MGQWSNTEGYHTYLLNLFSLQLKRWDLDLVSFETYNVIDACSHSETLFYLSSFFFQLPAMMSTTATPMLSVCMTATSRATPVSVMLDMMGMESTAKSWVRLFSFFLDCRRYKLTKLRVKIDQAKVNNEIISNSNIYWYM